MITQAEVLTAKELRTVSCNPIEAYARGFDAAVYQRAYYNPYRDGTQAQREYVDGYKDGEDSRALTAAMGD